MIRFSKQSLRWAMAVVLFATHSVVHAIREEKVFEVAVHIPTVDFYVLPAEPAFLQNMQHMKWDFNSATFLPVNALFNVRSTNSYITARLAQEAKLTSERLDASDIALKVSFNYQALSLTDTEVVSSAVAQGGKQVPLRIEAVEPAGGFLPGTYYGTVTIIFDAQII